jgi:hypothetical protein
LWRRNRNRWLLLFGDDANNWLRRQNARPCRFRRKIRRRENGVLGFLRKFVNRWLRRQNARLWWFRRNGRTRRT